MWYVMIVVVVLVWYIVTELGSMAESAVPKWLTKLLVMSKSAADGAGDMLSGEDGDGA